MKKTAKALVAGSVFATVTLGSGAAMAELSSNFGVTSNYLWRGVTQSNDSAAVSGGIDYTAGGFYAGTWTSSLAGGDYELDLYGGFAGEAGALGYDVGVITYQYPVSESGFHELYVNGSSGMFDAGLAYTIGSDDDDTAEFSSGDLYLHVGVSTETATGLGIGATVGSYDFDDAAGGDYTHFGVHLSKDDLTFAIDKNDLDGGDEPRVSISWSKALDL